MTTKYQVSLREVARAIPTTESREAKRMSMARFATLEARVSPMRRTILPSTMKNLCRRLLALRRTMVGA